MTIRVAPYSLFLLEMLYTVLLYIAIAVAVLAVVVLAWLWYMGMFSRIHVSLREVPEMTIMFVVGYYNNMQQYELHGSISRFMQGIHGYGTENEGSVRRAGRYPCNG